MVLGIKLYIAIEEEVDSAMIFIDVREGIRKCGLQINVDINFRSYRDFTPIYKYRIYYGSTSVY